MNPKREAVAVPDLLKGGCTAAEVWREYDLKQSALDECIELFIQDRTHRPKSRPEDEKALQEEWEGVLERGATLSHQILRHE